MKILFSLLLGVACTAAAAQLGIRFEQGNWKAVLAKAKAEDKLVFIDVYTGWCGPCKKMVAEVFPLQEVGDVFNASFVNYKLDAEKGEGVHIARSFSVHAYPTYLFVNGDGELVYRLSGYHEAKAFLHHAGIALKEKSDPKPLEKWNAEYAAGKRDKDFLAGYLKKRSVLKLPSAELIEELVPLASSTDFADSVFVSALLYFDANAEYLPGGQMFNYVSAHFKAIDALLGKSKGYSLRLLQMGIRNYFLKNIIPNRKEEMVAVAGEAGKMLSKLLGETDAEVSSRRWSLDYYNKTGDDEKTLAAAVDFVNNGLLKMNVAAIMAADEAAFTKFMEPYLSGQKDSLVDEHWSMRKRLAKNSGMVSFSYQLRDAAEAVYFHTEDPKYLAMAAGWAEKAQDWFPHFSSEAVLAALMYKLGLTKQGIASMEHAAGDAILDQNPAIRQLLLANADGMQQSKAPQKVWRL